MVLVVLASLARAADTAETTHRAESSSQQTPNVLLICVDDLRPEIGAFGAKHVRTPNIDKLAATGRPFAQHFVQVPTCGASRYALLTGERPKSRESLGNGAFSLLSRERGEAPESFPELFRRAGYRTVSIGKISHQPAGRRYRKEGAGQGEADPEMPHSWDEVGLDAGKWKDGWSAFFGYGGGTGRERGVSRAYESMDVDDEGYPDGLIARQGVEALRKLAKGRREKKQPFLLAVGFFKPHLPFNAPKRYWDLYDREKVPLSPCPMPPTDVDSKLALHSSGELLGNYGTHPKGKTANAEYVRTLKHAYLACVSYADAQIGKVLDELDRLELREETIVVLWGDHGWHLGDLGIWGKHTAFEWSLHSPLIIRVPGQKQAGVATRGLVETLDVYPTLAALAGLEAPDGLGGSDVSRLISDPARPGKDAAFGYWRRGGAVATTIRTETHRFVRWTKGAERVSFELYDRRVDPFETKNIAAQHGELVEQLERRLESP